MNEAALPQPVTGNEAWLKRFLFIFSGQALSIVGSAIVQFAVIWYLTITTGSATVLAIAGICGFLPQVILTPIAGTYVDRWKRRYVMIAADGLIALSTVVLIALFAFGVVQFWEILVLLAVRSSFSSFHWPAAQAATTLLVPEQHLARVGGLTQAVMGLSSIMAPPIAAVLFAFVSMEFILAIDVVTALAAIIPLAMIKIPEPVRSDERKSVMAEMKESLAFMRSWKGMIGVVAIFMVANMLAAPAFSLLPLLVVDHFGGTAIDYASVEALAGVGTLVGGVALGVWGGTKRKMTTVMASLLLGGFSVLAIGLVPSTGFLILLALALLVGSMFSILNGSINAMLQCCIPPAMQGRIFALVAALAMSMSPVGLAIGGPMAEVFGIQPWFLLAGGAMAVMAVASLLVPNIMTVEDRRIEKLPSKAEG
ncbi:MAG: enterobactin exporter EntS [Methanomassiliicoccales archaeon PtaU1.Bin124]|nr:MAG: enterobactin exporter EntS [Methanomassiliicoccales archaeon PtaU1.Bin124]